MKKLFFFLFNFILLLVFVSCEKEEGPGGTAKIIGNVWVKDYNADFSQLITTYWAEEEDVYLMYGADSIHSDKTETTYNGAFMFEYLQEGDYTVFVYSKDSTLTSASGRIPMIVNVSIAEKGEVLVIPTINIFN